MANFLELDISSGVIQQKNPISVGNSALQSDTTNASKIIQTNTNGKLDSSFFERDTDIKNLNVSGAFSFWGTDWSISSGGNINVYDVRYESYADNTHYDCWAENTQVCVDFYNRKLLPRSEYTYEPSVDWSDENCVTTRMVDDSAAYNWGFFARTDFSSGSTDGRGFFTTVNTLGGTIFIDSLDASTSNGCHATLNLSTSTSSTGTTQARGNYGFQLKSSFSIYEWTGRVKISNLSTSSEEFSVQIGIQNSLTSTNALSTRNHIIFHYDRATYGSDNWHAVTRTSADSGTVTDTGVSASTSFQKLYFIVDQNSAAVRVRFYINGTLEATHTATVPENTALHPRVAILKSIGTTSRSVHLDYMYHKMKFLSHQDRV